MHKPKKIALQVETAGSYTRGLVRGIAHYASIHGVWSIYHHPSNQSDFVGLVKQWKPDGIILRGDIDLKQTLDLNIPTVIAVHSKGRNNASGVPVIVTDDIEVGILGAEHFIGLGFTSYAFCSFQYHWSLIRARSFTETLSNAGYCPSILTCTHQKQALWWVAQQKKLTDWLSMLRKPVAVMACNDVMAHLIIEACKTSKLLIPEQVSVLGVDNDEITCEVASPKISSIAIDSETAGFEAAAALDALMNGHTCRESVIVARPTRIVSRKSTSLLAIEDKKVAAAVRFIRENCSQAIQVDDVVDATSISRRALEQRFKATIGRSIALEIRRIRIEEVARLLIDTDLSVLEISLRLGYSGSENISRYFRQEKKMSCQQWRSKYRKT